MHSDFNGSGKSCLLAGLPLTSVADASCSSRQRAGVILTQLTLVLVPPSQSRSFLPSHLFPTSSPGSQAGHWGTGAKGELLSVTSSAREEELFLEGFFWRVALPDCLPCQHRQQFIFQWSKKPHAANVNGVACSSAFLSPFPDLCFSCEL